MAIPGIPNSYKSRNYRSLLETRWAIMFEKLGWQAEYEPFELNGWIPDFILIGKHKSLLVEVKPFTHLEQYNSAIAKIESAVSGTDYECSETLLLGVNPVKKCEYWPQFVAIGWIGEYDDDSKHRWYAEAMTYQLSDSEFCLASSEGGYGDRIHGGNFKNCWIGPDHISIEIANLWADAGSQTQWKAPSFVSKAAASQAEARRRFALPPRKAPDAQPVLEVDASPIVTLPPLLPKAFKGDGLKMRMIMKELHRLNRGLALVSLDAAQQVACEGDVIVATFDEVSQFSSRLAGFGILFQQIGMRLFKRPLKIEVQFSHCTNR